MGVVQEERVTYQAECEWCGARGPACDTGAGAIEGVTANAATKETGISLLGRWRTFRGSLFCPGCANRVESQSR
jgi:hypothetical protein